MRINLITMMTRNDRTIPNAKEVFEAAKGARTPYWGFKDVGIDLEKARDLVGAMKAEGKTTFIEPLVEEEEGNYAAAEFAIECGFEYFVGSMFYPRVGQILKENDIRYFPTCGRREGIPRMLYGTVEDIISDAKRIASYGVDGVSLSVYRYVDGDPEDMALKFRRQIDMPIIITGSINTLERLDFVKSMKPWGFTLGSALFDDSFAGDTVSDKLDRIVAYLEK